MNDPLSDMQRRASQRIRYNSIAESAGIGRATVRCRQCGREERVNGGWCLKHGWPKCCKGTMTLITSDNEDD